jgi:cytochrome P450
MSPYFEEKTYMTTTARLEPIPPPPGHLFVGNLFDLDANHPIESMMDLARAYGPIFQIDMPGGNSRVVVSGFDLVNELCDESRFDKMLGRVCALCVRARSVGACLRPRRRTRTGTKHTTFSCPHSAWMPYASITP